MKKKELTDLRAKTVKDLLKLAGEKKLESFKKKVENTGKKDVKNYRNLRRDIAQILTIVREKEILEKLEKRKEKTNN